MVNLCLKCQGLLIALVDPLQKTKKKNQEFKETGDTIYIYKNELDKTFFQHDRAYGDLKDLTKKKTASNQILKVKHLILLKILNMIDINAELHQWFTNFFIKRLQTVHPKIHTNNKIKQNQRLLDLATQKLAEELQESIIKKF